MKRILHTFLAFTLSVLVAAPAYAQQCAGIRMPERVTVAGNELVLNGMGVREATFLNVDVYVAGLYLPNRTRDAGRILNQDQPRHLVLHLVRDVSREEMVDALRQGFRNAAGEDLPQMQSRVQRLAQMIPALSEGDTITFTYVPERGLTVGVNGRNRGTVEGADFARTFYAIWLGDQPPNPGLRSGLLGGGC